MPIRSFSVFVALFFLSLSSFATVYEAGEMKVETLSSAEVATINDAHRLTFNSASGTYFLSDASRFLIDFAAADQQMPGVAKVRVRISDNEVVLPGLSAFLLSGLEEGSHKLIVEPLDAGGNVLAFGMGGHKATLKVLAKKPLITNDAIVLGILVILLGAVFYTSGLDTPFWKKFYTYIPSLFVCYFLPSVLNSLGVFSGELSSLYFVASRYLLPAALVLLTLSTDLKGIFNLGPKSVIMFLTGTVGIVIGGPLAILLISAIDPTVVGGEGADAVWRGMTTIAGSWIGGGANQAAMLEVFGASGSLFSGMVAVDIIVANIWMAFLLYGAGRSKSIDRFFKADSSAIDDLRSRIENYRLSIAKMPTLRDTMIILAIALGAVGLSHLLSDWITPFMGQYKDFLESIYLQSFTSGFFWLVVVATTVGLILSFTKARKLEGVGASRIGSVFIYILVATIGMKMDVVQIFTNPGFFIMGVVWMLIHVGLLLLVGRLIKAPFFFVAVGSQANVGGAASAPIVASAFSPALASVGVLLAVLGYTLGTYGALLCGILMEMVAP